VVMSPAGLGPENDCPGEDQQLVNDRLVLSSERAPHINKLTTDSNKNLVLGPRRGLGTKTDLPTDRRS
jgi:hypothetical protein